MPSLSWEDFGLLPVSWRLCNNKGIGSALVGVTTLAQDSSSNLCISDHSSAIGCMEKPECCVLKQRPHQNGRGHPLLLLLGHFRWGQLSDVQLSHILIIPPLRHFACSHPIRNISWLMYFRVPHMLFKSDTNGQQLLIYMFLVISTMTWELHPSWTVATLKFD